MKEVMNTNHVERYDCEEVQDWSGYALADVGQAYAWLADKVSDSLGLGRRNQTIKVCCYQVNLVFRAFV